MTKRTSLRSRSFNWKAVKRLDLNGSMGSSQKCGEDQRYRVDLEGSFPCHNRRACSRGGNENINLVPKAGLEPARLAPHAPQTCVSAISPLRHSAGACPHNCVFASLKLSTSSAVRLGLSLVAALLQGLLKLRQFGMREQIVDLFCARISRFTNDERLVRGSRIIEVG